MKQVQLRLVSIIIFLLFSIPNVFSTDYYVSPGGDDSNIGSIDQPFQTIQAAVNFVSPGDIIHVLPGIYKESVLIQSGGTASLPITIIAEPGTVLLDGTEETTNEWDIHQGNIYKTSVEGPVEQIFVGDSMMLEARWPNMNFPEELWSRSVWSSADDGSIKGKMVDASLAESSIDWTGATAVLNVSHQWWTWTSVVTNHSAGSNSFLYRTDNMSGMYDEDSYSYEDDFYYLKGKLEALDVPGEWYFDAAENVLYLFHPDERKPLVGEVRIKRRDYGIIAQNADYLNRIFSFFT
jgi:hypothetical protein